MSILTDDLDAIFADTSLTVSVEFAPSGPPQSVLGFLSSQDVPENDGAGGVTIVSRRIVRVQDDALTFNGKPLDNSAQNQSITVDGVVYVIHGVRSGGRGKTLILLA